MRKKIYLLFASLFAVLALSFSGVLVTNTYAADCGPMNDFMGLTPWYKSGSGSCLLEDSNWKSEDKITVSIWTIVLNIVGDVVGVVGYLAILMVIWGGYLYMFSQGEPAKAAKGKTTIRNAMIGLVVTVLASTISKTITGILGEAGAANIFVNVFNHAFTWAAIVAVAMIIIGGIYYATSTGDPGKVSKAKNTIMYASIGLLIVILSIAIVNTVLGAL